MKEVNKRKWDKREYTHTAGVHWKTKVNHVDIDTGEELTKHNAERNYIKIATDKHTIINQNKTHGTITYTIKWQRSKQQRLFD